MKRTVKAWALTCLGNSGRAHVAVAHFYWTRREAINSRWPGQIVIPVTITYDDGKKPRKKAAKR